MFEEHQKTTELGSSKTIDGGAIAKGWWHDQYVLGAEAEAYNSLKRDKKIRKKPN